MAWLTRLQGIKYTNERKEVVSDLKIVGVVKNIEVVEGKGRGDDGAERVQKEHTTSCL